MINAEIKKKFLGWWNHTLEGRPMLRIMKKKEVELGGAVDLSRFDNARDFHINPEFRVQALINFMKGYDFMAEGIPYVDLNLGPGSMAAYLGREPKFLPDTVWYDSLKVDTLGELPPLKFDKNATWLKFHLDVIKKAVELAKGKFPICIPDILENIDVLALIRGNEELCYDIMDEPETVKEYLKAIEDSYMDFYNAFYDEVKNENGECCYTAFSLWAPDKCAKIQCDFSCLLSPNQFDEFILPSLRRQTEEIPYTMYHLDGKDAVKHLDSIMKLDKLNALQWTPGAGEADGGDEKWYGIYDKVMDSGKSLWISFCDGDVSHWAKDAKKILKRYGNNNFYFHFPVVDEKEYQVLKKTFKID